MSESNEYVPPKVWKEVSQGGKWGKLNRSVAGPISEKELPLGTHALQLYSMGTPNGVKVTSLLEELNLHYGIEYDAHYISIGDGDQFSSGFVAANPNSKIPALLHYEKGFDAAPTRVFETTSIMLYLCEKFDKDHVFLPAVDDPLRAECISWLMWTHGSAPFLGGGFGHFYYYAPVKIEYAIDRYAKETKRQLDVLNRHLGGLSDGPCAGGPYLCGEKFTIADIGTLPWYGWMALGRSYNAEEFLQVDSYTHLVDWAKRVELRKGMSRGRLVNRTWGDEKALKERHAATDFDALET